MKRQKQEFTVIDCWGLNNSVYGNPKKGLTLLDNNGDYYTAKTATNAAVAYLLGYYSKGRKYIFTYHYTNNGNMIIDYGQAVEA